MILAIVCIYLALGAIFYQRLTATATDASARPHRETMPHWHRARRLSQAVMRRVRSLPPRH